MSETAIAVKDEERTELKEKIAEICGYAGVMDALDQELTQSMEDVDPTVGNVVTLVCRCIVKFIIGDELFSTDLSMLSDEEAEEALKAAGTKIIDTTKAWKDEIVEIATEYAEAHNDE